MSAVDPLQCPVCPRRLASVIGTANHFKIAHRSLMSAGLRIECGLCGLQFIQSEHLTRHMQKHTGLKSRAGRCYFCGVEVLRMKPHVKECHPAIQCLRCGQNLSTVAAYDAHKFVVHELAECLWEPQPLKRAKTRRHEDSN